MVFALQVESPWSPAQTIPLYDPETWPPILIADQNRTVHAFSYQGISKESSEGSRVIVYNNWTLERGWTAPVDIVLSPNKEARLTDAYLDKNGFFNVVFWGGDGTYADIYYSKAPAESPNDSHAWSLPVIIAENAGDPQGAVFAEDDQGTLHVLYNGRELGNGVYVVHSKDGGETWSDSIPIFFTNSAEPNIRDLQILRSKSGWFHAIWGVYTESSQGRGVYHTRSADAINWNEPILLADAAEDSLGIQGSTLFEYQNKLFALYITEVDQISRIVMRQSSDEGGTWTDQSMIFPRHRGANGSIAAVIDGNNDLHLFFGQRIPGEPDVHGMWHSMFVNNRWLEPEGLIRGTKIIDKEGYSSFDPNAARAVVSQGNVILVTWRTDPGSKGNGVWYSYKKIDAPELPVSPLLASNMEVVTSPSPTMQGNMLSTTPLPPTPVINDYFTNSPSSSQNLGTILGGVGILMVMIIVVSLLMAGKRHKIN